MTDNVLEMMPQDHIIEEDEKNDYIPDNVFAEPVVLTDEDIETINKLRAQEEEKENMYITEEDADGNKTEVSVEEYVSSLDNREYNDGIEKLKLLNHGDIKDTVDDIKFESRDRMIKAMRSISPDGAIENISDDELMRINNEALKEVQDYLDMDKIDSAFIEKKFKKKPLAELYEILPKEFVEIYTTPEDRRTNPAAVKDKFISAITYMALTGPEMDYLNDYIENENKLSLVSKRLIQCQIDFTEMIKDEKKLSEVIAESYKIVPKDDSFWAKYIKVPNKISNEFAQRVVIFDHYRTAYMEVLEDYPDTEENAPYRAMIQEEIEECEMKMKVYASVCNMELLPVLWNRLVSRHRDLIANNKFSIKFMTKEAVDAVERIRKCKQDLPFPAYDGHSKNAEEIFKNFHKVFTMSCANYNSKLEKIIEQDENADKSMLIKLDGISDGATHTVYSVLLAILMGRVVKNLARHTCTKYDAIVMDSYFRIFCKLNSDIYISQFMWNMMKEHVEEIIAKYFADRH